ncbi:MAG: tRNA (adenosine(37)-N6)-dimethylallyltransferase MiaA, partial [bacterium]|nr:tRNA (adenosine(37)-N6)-dimethylallyltransferase MiaA [bacterium]
AALPTLAALGIGSLKVALAVEREVLAQRVRQRARAMIAGGLLEEAQALAGRAVPAGDAVGYPQASAYLRGMMTRAELEEALTRATMRYAKRQMTWLRGEPALQWIPAGAGAAKALERAARETLGWT